MDIREEAVQGDAKLSAKLRDEIASIVCWTEWLDWNDLNISQAEIIADALMPLVARIQAEALREAAEVIENDPYARAVFWDAERRNYVKPGAWLRARADRQENPT